MVCVLTDSQMRRKRLLSSTRATIGPAGPLVNALNIQDCPYRSMILPTHPTQNNIWSKGSITRQYHTIPTISITVLTVNADPKVMVDASNFKCGWVTYLIKKFWAMKTQGVKKPQKMATHIDAFGSRITGLKTRLLLFADTILFVTINFDLSWLLSKAPLTPMHTAPIKMRKIPTL